MANLGPDGRVSHSAGHTPGPWRAKPWAAQECGIQTAYPHPETGQPIHIAGAVAKVDGPLIAAAPLLLEALEWAIADMRGVTKYTDPEQWNNCMDRAEAAISSARGGQ